MLIKYAKNNFSILSLLLIILLLISNCNNSEIEYEGNICFRMDYANLGSISKDEVKKVF